MRHRIPPNIDPLKKYATYIELIQKSQDSEILTKHLTLIIAANIGEAAGFISPAAISLAAII